MNKQEIVENEEQEQHKETAESVNDEGIEEAITSEQVSLPVVPTLVPKLPEKPKVTFRNQRSEDDVEEFDTDDEEEVKETEVRPNSDYSKHVTYEGDKCIYTEPGSGKKLEWNKEKNEWCAVADTNLEGNDAFKNYQFDGKNYVYTDKATNITYKFDNEKNEWVTKEVDSTESDETKENNSFLNPNSENLYGFEDDTHTYTDPNDGTKYMWDREKNAWFPKLDDEFMARYQLNYGFTNNSTETDFKNPPKSEAPKKLTKEEKKAENKRKNQEPPKWFDIDEAHNTSIYVTGLPLDITEEEIKELFTKCGLLARNEKGKDKIKIYREPTGEMKGDARCTYIKKESVDLALDILDGWQIKGKTLHVEKAKFTLKGEYDPSLKPKKKKKDKEKQKKIQEKLFDWRPDKLRGEPQKCERVVVIKNLFTPEDFDKDVKLILEYQQDIRTECSKFGDVKKVVIHDRNPQGVAQVTFACPEEAQECIKRLNGRYFSQRKIIAEIWDGKTKYKIHETEEEIEARLNKWEKYLEDADEEKNKEKPSGSGSSQSGA